MKTALVVESHPQTLELVCQTLREAGLRVVEASNPGKAWELFVSAPPDVVVVAVDLAMIQGQPLSQAIRKSPGGARWPIVAVDKGHQGKARGVSAVLDLGVNAYVADPTRRADLVQKVEQTLAAAQQAPKPSSGLAATLTRPPVVSSDLKSRALPAQAHSWFRLGRDGVLVAAHGELTRHVYYLKGAPVNYDSTARQDSLPSWLADRKALTAAQHKEVLQQMSEAGLSAGAALVAVGVVEVGDPLLAIMRAWMRDKIGETYAMSAGRYGFWAGAEFEKEVPSLELPPLAPIYEAARAHWAVKAVASALAPSMKSYPARTPDFSRDLAALGLATSDLKLALEIDGRLTLKELLAQGKTDLRQAYALVWYLSTVGSVAFSSSPAASAAPGVDLGTAGARPTARRRKPLPEAKTRELSEEAIRVLTGSYFRVLNLDITADSEAVERAYHEAATRFHPDSYPEHDLSAIEDVLASVQDKLSAAYRVLTEEVKRKAYVAYLLSRADVVRSAPLVVDAEIELKRGEGLMKRGDWKGALAAFEQAASKNAREPEYLSYLAWATLKAGEGTPGDRAKAAAKLARRALSMNPALERPQVIAAIIADEMGQPAEARRMLLKLLKAHPACALAKKTLQSLSKRHGAAEKT